MFTLNFKTLLTNFILLPLLTRNEVDNTKYNVKLHHTVVSVVWFLQSFSTQLSVV